MTQRYFSLVSQLRLQDPGSIRRIPALLRRPPPGPSPFKGEGRVGVGFIKKGGKEGKHEFGGDQKKD
jgi:hypothetical protein